MMQHPERIYDTYVQKLDQLKSLLVNNINNSLRNVNNAVQMNKQRLISNSPQTLIQQQMSILNLLNEKLSTNAKSNYTKNLNNFKNQVNKLDGLSPLKTLSRGYSVVTKDSKVLSKVKDFEKNDKINIKVSDGEISAIVDEVK